MSFIWYIKCWNLKNLILFAIRYPCKAAIRKFVPKNYLLNGYSIGTPMDLNMHMSMTLFVKYHVVVPSWTIPSLIISLKLYFSIISNKNPTEWLHNKPIIFKGQTRIYVFFQNNSWRKISSSKQSEFNLFLLL